MILIESCWGFLHSCCNEILKVTKLCQNSFRFNPYIFKENFPLIERGENQLFLTYYLLNHIVIFESY